jgi:kinesin family protein C2/C3
MLNYLQDLLSDGPGAKIEVRESVQGVVSIHGARHVPVTCAEDVEAVARRGQRNRAVGSTKCNNQSSRSHMVLMIDLEVRERSVFENPEASTSDHRVVSTGRISLVDLAGSERISKSEASGAALTEAKHINKSLSALIDVISALSERERKSKLKQQQQKDGQSTSGAETKTRKSSQASNETTSDVFHHIPFRNSKLTHLLMGSLKPGSKLVFIAQIAPENEHVVETCNTLEFGTRAKGVELGKVRDYCIFH